MLCLLPTVDEFACPSPCPATLVCCIGSSHDPPLLYSALVARQGERREGKQWETSSATMAMHDHVGVAPSRMAGAMTVKPRGLDGGPPAQHPTARTNARAQQQRQMGIEKDVRTGVTADRAVGSSCFSRSDRSCVAARHSKIDSLQCHAKLESTKRDHSLGNRNSGPSAEAARCCRSARSSSSAWRLSSDSSASCGETECVAGRLAALEEAAAVE